MSLDTNMSFIRKFLPIILVYTNVSSRKLILIGSVSIGYLGIN